MKPHSGIGPQETSMRIALHQHGVMSRIQAIEAGMTNAGIGRWLASGRWVRCLPGVYRVAGTPGSWKQRLMAASLWGGPGTAASHRSAAGLLGLDGVDLGALEITIPKKRRAPYPALIVHNRKSEQPAMTGTKDGIPITDACSTLIDLAAVLDQDRLTLTLDDALRRHLTSPARLEWRLRQLSSQHKRGAAVLKRLIQDRRTNAIPESRFESRVDLRLGKADLPV